MKTYYCEGTASLILWLIFAFSVGLVPPYVAPEPVCGNETEGTDSYWECTTGSKLDLTPIIEDEAQVTTKEGNR